MSSQVVCRFFGPEKGCKYGDNCRFLHSGGVSVATSGSNLQQGVPEKFHCKHGKSTECTVSGCPYWHWDVDPKGWCNTTSHKGCYVDGSEFAAIKHHEECFHFRPKTPCKNGDKCPGKDTSCFWKHPEPISKPAYRVVVVDPDVRTCVGFRYECNNAASFGDKYCGYCRKDADDEDHCMMDFHFG